MWVFNAVVEIIGFDRSDPSLSSASSYRIEVTSLGSSPIGFPRISGLSSSTPRTRSTWGQFRYGLYCEFASEHVREVGGDALKPQVEGGQYSHLVMVEGDGRDLKGEEVDETSHQFRVGGKRNALTHNIDLLLPLHLLRVFID